MFIGIGYGQARNRRVALEDHGWEVFHLDTSPYERWYKDRPFSIWLARLNQAFLLLFRYYLVPPRFYRDLTRALEEYKPDVIHIDRGRAIPPSFLVRARELGGILLHFLGDDIRMPLCGTRYLYQGISLYDCLFTPRRFQVEEFLQLGARRAEWEPLATHPQFHYPVDLSSEDRNKYGHPVIFIGSYEAQRAEWMESIANLGLVIYGNGWHHLRRSSPLRKCWKGREANWEELPKIYGASRVCITFTRKGSRDQHDSRSFEIPACKGFMLAERTDDHLEFFQDGEEFVSFDSPQQLQELACRYLKDEMSLERERIRQRGYERFLRDHTTTKRIRCEIEVYEELRS